MKSNLFTVLIAIVVLAALAIFYFGVVSYYQNVSSQKVQLSENKDRIARLIAKKDDVPSQKWIELYESRQKELDGEIVRVKEYYMGMDKSLEKWFPALKVSNGAPSFGDFKTMYLDKKTAKIKELKAKKIYVSFDEDARDSRRAEEGRDLGFGEPTEANIGKLQKHFWIQEFLFSAMLDSGVIRCDMIEFPDKPASFTYGSYIPFVLTVRLQNKNVPSFMYNLMRVRNAGGDIAVALMIKSVSLTRISEEIEGHPEWMDIKNIPEKDRDSYKPEVINPPISRLYIEGDVLDFDFTVKSEPVPVKRNQDNEKKKPK